MVCGIDVVRPRFKPLDRHVSSAKCRHQSQCNCGFAYAASCSGDDDSRSMFFQLTPASVRSWGTTATEMVTLPLFFFSISHVSAPADNRAAGSLTPYAPVYRYTTSDGWGSSTV